MAAKVPEARVKNQFQIQGGPFLLKPGALIEQAEAEATLAADKVKLGKAITHLDASLPATDGAKIAFRTTAPAGKPKAVLVLMMGTLGKAEHFDGMSLRLAAKGILSYAIEPRSSAPHYSQHAKDLQEVVKLATAQHPNAKLTVGGVSLGSMIALDWSAKFNPHGTPVLAMAPVAAPKFMGPIDMLKVGGSLVSDRIGKLLVATPMSNHVPLTSNPRSPEFHIKNPEKMKVPASLFGDVAKMSGDVALNGHKMKGPLLVTLGGSDQVAINGVTSLFTKLINSADKAVETFPKLAHDMSQEWHNPAFLRRIAKYILPR